MRKLVALLLISLLSLQASWAAAASYCRHEQGAAARHFGHHEHQHGHPWQKSSVQQGALSAGALAGDAGHEMAAADGVAAGLANADLDCSVCHAHALSGMPSTLTPSVLDVPEFSGAVLIQHPFPSVPQPRPERPNWSAA